LKPDHSAVASKLSQHRRSVTPKVTLNTYNIGFIKTNISRVTESKQEQLGAVGVRKLQLSELKDYVVAVKQQNKLIREQTVLLSSQRDQLRDANLRSHLDFSSLRTAL
jgi:hypothetical protein